MGTIIVHPRVMERHPELSEEDVRSAWENYVRMALRDDDDEHFVAIGFDGKSRVIEMVAVETIDGDWYVYHAMTPPSKATMRELGLLR